MLKAGALDIGGANIKACGPGAQAFTRPFDLWREPGRLAAVIAECVERFEPLEVLAVSMTGELCDCYSTKREGVVSILESVKVAMASMARPGRIAVWRVDGRFATFDEARRDPLPAAAANWLALARFAARFAPRGAGLLVDVGSTTTDVIPLRDGKPVPAGRTDTERLAAGELLYGGVCRTPVAAVVREIPYRGGRCPVAAELFATTRDAYILLGHLPEEPGDRRTADGRPATATWAAERLARMLCADRETFHGEDALSAAAHIFAKQKLSIRRAAARVLNRLGSPPETIVISGRGEFLARAATEGLGGRFVSLARELGAEVSTAATACALRELAEEMEDPLA